MNTVTRIAKNTGVLIISQVIGYILAFIYTIYLARYLGPSNFGILTFAIAFTAILSIVTDFGLISLMVREIARKKILVQQYISNLIPIKLILVIVSFGLIALIVNLLGYPHETIIVVYFFGLSIVIGTFNQLIFAVFQAFEKMEYQAIVTVINSIILFTGIILGINFKFDVISFSIIYVIASLVNLFCSFIFYRFKLKNDVGIIKKYFNFDFKFWTSTIKKTLPFFFAALFLTVGYKVDVIILSYIKGNEAVGWYTGATTLTDTLSFIPTAFVTAIYPIFSNYFQSSHGLLIKAYESSFKYMAILSLPIAAGTTLLADKIILYAYHSSFAQSIEVLRIIVWSVPFLYLYSILGLLLSSGNKQEVAMKGILIYMIINMISNLILIPYLSFVGASIVNVSTKMILFTLLYYFVQKTVFKTNTLRSLIKPAIGTGIMSLFIFSFNILNMSLFITIPLAILVYFGSLILFKTFSSDDLKMLKQIINPIIKIYPD